MTRTVDKYRPAGTRNWIRVDDTVKVKPDKGWSFLAKVQRIDVDDAGTVVAVHVGITTRCDHSPHPHRGKSRVVTPDRVSRVAQTKVPA